MNDFLLYLLLKPLYFHGYWYLILSFLPRSNAEAVLSARYRDLHQPAPETLLPRVGNAAVGRRAVRGISRQPQMDEWSRGTSGRSSRRRRRDVELAVGSTARPLFMFTCGCRCQTTDATCCCPSGKVATPSTGCGTATLRPRLGASQVCSSMFRCSSVAKPRLRLRSGSALEGQWRHSAA